VKLDFHKPKIQHRDCLQSILSLSGDLNSESAFGTLYLWCDAYDINVCVYKNILFKMTTRPFPQYDFPKGIKNLNELKVAIELLREDALERKLKEFRLTKLLDSELELLSKAFPSKFTFSESRNDFDYIYSISDLANLKGKKYHSKRNHISKFNKLYNWEYTKLSASNAQECLNFFRKWFKLNTDKESLTKISEYSALERAFKDYNLLNLTGSAIKVDGKMIACTVGERINSSTLLVHFEKAFSEFEGSYSVINNEFCKDQESEYELVNREEDMGIPGLRKSKLSYKPKFLVKKYNIKWED